MTIRSLTGVNRRTTGAAAARTDISGIRRVTAATALGLCALLALTGCIKMDMDLTVADDTVSGTMILAMDKKVLALTGQTEQEALASFNEEAPVPDGEGVRTERYSDDTFVGNKYTLTNVSLAKFLEGGTDEDALRIVHDTAAGRYRTTGVIDLSDTGTAPPEMASMLGSVEIRIAITFPGKVISHTGELNGTTVTWRAKVGEKTVLNAEAEDTSSNNLLLMLGFGIPVALLLIGLVVFLVVRGRSKGNAANSDTASTHSGVGEGEISDSRESPAANPTSTTNPTPSPSLTPADSSVGSGASDSGGGDSGGGSGGGGGGD